MFQNNALAQRYSYLGLLTNLCIKPLSIRNEGRCRLRRRSLVVPACVVFLLSYPLRRDLDTAVLTIEQLYQPNQKTVRSGTGKDCLKHAAGFLRRPVAKRLDDPWQIPK